MSALTERLRDWAQAVEMSWNLSRDAEGLDNTLTAAADRIEALDRLLAAAKADADERWSEGNYYKGRIADLEAENERLRLCLRDAEDQIEEIAELEAELASPIGQACDCDTCIEDALAKDGTP